MKKIICCCCGEELEEGMEYYDCQGDIVCPVCIADYALEHITFDEKVVGEE